MGTLRRQDLDPAFLIASLSAGGAAGSSTLTMLLALRTIAVVGADLAGSTVDRPGRTTVTSASTLTSGGSRIAAGYLLGASDLMLVLIVLVGASPSSGPRPGARSASRLSPRSAT